MKIKIISIAIILSLISYLFLANAYIYKEIGNAGLKSPDSKQDYIIKSSANQNNTIVYTALGDSLTAGVGVSNYEQSYAYGLAEKMSVDSGAVVLHDRAYAGAKTIDLINNLLPKAINDNPNIVTILIGVNDIHGNVSEKEFSANYLNILTQLKTKTKAKIFAISIPYLGTNTLLLPPYNMYFKYETSKFNAIIKKLAEENNIQYIDLYTPTENMFKDPGLYAGDLFHPSAKGYSLWSEIIYANINK